MFTAEEALRLTIYYDMYFDAQVLVVIDSVEEQIKKVCKQGKRDLYYAAPTWLPNSKLFRDEVIKILEKNGYKVFDFSTDEQDNPYCNSNIVFKIEW